MKKVISIILCIVMIFTMTAGIFAEDSKTLNYVSLGASQTLGLGLSGYYPKQLENWTGTYLEELAWNFLGWDAPTWNPTAIKNLNNPETGYNTLGLEHDIEGSLGNLVCKELTSRGYTVNYNQLAACAFRTQDLLMFLYDDLEFDSYQERFFTGEKRLFDLYTGSHDEKAIQSMRELYQNALKDADIISYDLGCANFTLNLNSILNNGPVNYELNYLSVFTEDEYKQYKKYEDIAKTAIVKALASYGIENTESIEVLIDALACTFTSYCVSFDKSMKWIFDNNPDATVIVMQIQNLVDGLVLNYNGIELPMGEMLQILITMANSYASALSKYSSRILYSKITDNNRVSFFIDEVASYEGPNDLTEELKIMLNIYSYQYDIYFKSMLTPVYESLGGYVYDKNYNDVLNASYDTFIKLIKHIYLSDSSCSMPEGVHVYAYIDVINALLLDTASGVLDGNGNDTAVENAINAFDSLSELEKSYFKYDLYSRIFATSLFHPNYEGYQQMADAVINTLDNGETGDQNRITGLQDAIKGIDTNLQNIGSFVVNKVKEKVNDTINNAVSNVKDEINSTVSTVKENVNNTVSNVKDEINNTVSTVKDNIEKAIVSPINSLLTKIKEMVK